MDFYVGARTSPSSYKAGEKEDGGKEWKASTHACRYASRERVIKGEKVEGRSESSGNRHALS